MKPLLIGFAPSRTAEDFRGRSGARIAELAGIGHADLHHVFDVRNLMDTYPGRRPDGKGDQVPPLQELRRLARRIDIDGRTVLFVGGQTAMAFDVRRPEVTLRWTPGRFARAGSLCRKAERFAVFPHPSGVNRFWNDPENELEAILFLRALLSSS